MSRKPKTPKAPVAGSIANAADLLRALMGITASAAKTLASVPWGSMYRPVSAGHVNKRGLFVAAIIDALADGSFDTLKSAMSNYSVPALRAELQYALATGDAAYFRSRKGDFCSWALPLVKDGALNAEASDADLARAFEATCPTNRANVNGMLTEITLAAQRRNVSPLPVFADAVVTGSIKFQGEGEQYASKGYGHATFTLA